MIKGIEVSESKLREVLSYILELDVEYDIKFKYFYLKKSEKKIYMVVIEYQ